jgi:hypothetical protein
MSNRSNPISPEVRKRTVRMWCEHPSLWAAIESIAPQIGWVPQRFMNGLNP